LFEIFSHGGFFALCQVILIDIVLAGDNAVVIGMSAARVPQGDRRKVIFWGLVAAVVLRIVLATFAVSLLEYIPLMIAGGILLLWVCWRLWRDIHKAQAAERAAKRAAQGETPCAPPFATHHSHPAAVRRAIFHIAAADVSMSLDNVLAVSGAAMHHWSVLVIGLALSVALMGLAAGFVAKLLHRYPWISYAGIFIVLFVALRMIWTGCVLMLQANS